MVTFCSIAATNTLAQARVLAESVHAHEPEARVIVLLAGVAAKGLLQPETFDVLTADALDTKWSSPKGGRPRASWSQACWSMHWPGAPRRQCTLRPRCVFTVHLRPCSP